jgi:hypothetical protein
VRDTECTSPFRCSGIARSEAHRRSIPSCDGTAFAVFRREGYRRIRFVRLEHPRHAVLMRSHGSWTLPRQSGAVPIGGGFVTSSLSVVERSG